MPDIRYQIAVNQQLDNDLTAEAAEIEVQQSIEGPTTFRIRVAMDICDSEMHLIDDARLNPGQPDTEITVMALLSGKVFVLSHGVIVERQVNLVEGGPGSYLEIRGQDRRAVMKRLQRCVAHSGTAADIVVPIFGNYGFESDVVNTPIEYDEDSNTLNQTESDLEFVEKIAGRSDSRFWLDWKAEQGLAGLSITETAHFKPSPAQSANNPLGFLPIQSLTPAINTELRINSGDGCSSNVASFDLKSNEEAPNQSGPVQRVASDTSDVDETEVPESTTEALAETQKTQERTRRVVSAGNAQEAQLRNQAALNDASWSVLATAEISVHALDNVLAAHDTVKVSGAGKLNSGDYFIKSVTHVIDATDHKMRLELMRNGLGAST